MPERENCKAVTLKQQSTHLLHSQHSFTRFTSLVSIFKEHLSHSGLFFFGPLHTETLLNSASALEEERVVCLLDVCLLGEDRLEIICAKVYRTADIITPV